MPLISVVMCTYNGEKYIDEQIQSILLQDYTPVELVIVDDGSTDGTWQKLQQWQQQSPLIQLYQNEQNLGYNKNFEKAARLAAGDFIAFADQDDVWLPQKLSKLMACFTSSDVLLAHSRSVRLENGKLDFNKASLQYQFSGNDTRKLFLFNQVNGHDMLFRKSLLQHALPIPAGMFYDWWIAVTATCYGTIAAVPEFLTHHRIHGANSFFSSNAPSKKKELDMEPTLRLFESMPVMDTRSRAYLAELRQFVSAHSTGQPTGFDLAFFRFLFRNRNLIFGHKRRLFPLLSYIKNAIKYAGVNFKEKGLSF